MEEIYVVNLCTLYVHYSNLSIAGYCTFPSIAMTTVNSTLELPMQTIILWAGQGRRDSTSTWHGTGTQWEMQSTWPHSITSSCLLPMRCLYNTYNVHMCAVHTRTHTHTLHTHTHLTHIHPHTHTHTHTHTALTMYPPSHTHTHTYIYTSSHCTHTQFNPELVIVSCGFDAAEGDPLGRYRLTPAGYAHMTHLLSGLANGKLVVAMEGGELVCIYMYI